MSTLKEIIRHCLFEGIPVELTLEPDAKDGTAYVVAGFAKSGNAKVYEDTQGTFMVHLRYGEVESIETFENLAHICRRWCENYKDSGYDVGCWEQAFMNLGWLGKRVKTELEWK